MKKKKNKVSILGVMLLTISLCVSLGLGIAIGFVGGLVKNQPILNQKEMQEQINNISQNSEVYFGSGERLGTINSELIRKVISYDEMGDNVKNAIVASEDANFYSNNGVEPLAILKATFSEITKKSSLGGSTITQQLVKNQMLDNSRSYERKAKEILLALRMNNYFSKREILETYLNVAPFGKNSLGQNISGIETAAMGIFGIHAKDLNIAQAAYLVGFVQSPYKYTPFDSSGNIRSDKELQAGLNRQKYVLERMLANNYITTEQYNDAKKFNIKGAFTKQRASEYTDYPYIRDEVTTSVAEILAEQTAKKNNKEQQFKEDSAYRDDLIEKSKTKFITGGYKVKTTLNKKLYDTLQEVRKDFKSYPTSTQNGTVYPLEIGASVIENNTGKILAFIGGMDYNKQQLNHATRTHRSPGSTIKPLLVYGPAIDKGYITPNSTLLDKRFNYNGWKPENFSLTEYGNLSARQALARSLNLATIRLYSGFVNENPAKDYLEKMNFKGITPNDQNNLAAAIGGMAHGVSVTENTNAFATFANMGEYKKAYIIEEIRNNENEIVYRATHTPTRVYKDSTSYLILNMLNDVINASYGTAPDIAKELNFNNKNLFVKTGTSEYYKDLWVVGGTKNITVGTWTGYDKPATVPNYIYGHKTWIRIMNAIYSHDSNLVSPDTSFTKPKSVVDSKINPYNNSSGSISDMIPEDFKELSKEKTLQKFGYNIDKSIMFVEPKKEVKSKDTEDTSKENKKDNSSPSNRSEDDNDEGYE
ncbi:transglycosylase domain-containing protein [Gemella cuniculi]|uniref:transglycosylase domain-containing protein n=1 Tax=Gemella cuniculi TaxID=150240 RepID=UPI0003F920EC|nr:transglycosylase domain-containing protein [Gemella cuniculi]